MTRLLLLAAAWLVLVIVPALPQGGQSVVVSPKNVNVQNSSSTITSTGVFQSLWTASTTQVGRSGCTVQNKSATNHMSVFAGPIASATTALSADLAPGQTYFCGAPGELVVRDQISITGTIGDAFYATQY